MVTFLEKSCFLDYPYVLFVFGLFVILVIIRFGFEGCLWILITSVPDRCILFYFYYEDYESFKFKVRQSEVFSV